MFSTYILENSFIITVTLFQSIGKTKKSTCLILFRQIIFFILLAILLPKVGGMGIYILRLAIVFTDVILVVIIATMTAAEFHPFLKQTLAVVML